MALLPMLQVTIFHVLSQLIPSFYRTKAKDTDAKPATNPKSSLVQKEQTPINSSNNIFEEAKAEPNKVKQSPLKVEQKKVV